MDRAYTRYRRKVALARKLRILRDHWNGWGFLEPRGKWHDHPVRYNWESDAVDGAHLMNTPGWWTHERMIVPSRREASTRLREVKAGRDPEGMVWPDYRKPHTYYW